MERVARLNVASEWDPDSEPKQEAAEIHLGPKREVLIGGTIAMTEGIAQIKTAYIVGCFEIESESLGNQIMCVRPSGPRKTRRGGPAYSQRPDLIGLGKRGDRAKKKAALEIFWQPFTA